LHKEDYTEREESAISQEQKQPLLLRIFCSINFNCSGFVLSHSCSLQSLGVFLLLWHQFIVLYFLPAGVGRKSASSPQYTPECCDTDTITQGYVFRHLCYLQPWLPITDARSFIFMKWLQLLGPYIVLSIFVLSSLSLCTSTSSHWLWHPLLDPDFSFLLNKMLADDNQYSTDVIL